jgi:O-antigen/teichoic acid export membrane protein
MPLTDTTAVLPREPGTAEENRRYGKLAKRGVAWEYLRGGVTELIAVPSAIVLARLLTPFDFGIGAAAAFFLSIAARLTNVGFNQALVKVKHLRREHCSSVFVISLALGSLVSLILAVSSSQLAALLRTPQLARVLPVAGLSFIIRGFGTVPSALMVREFQYGRNALPDWISNVGEALATILLAYTGWGYWSIVYGGLIGDVLNSGTTLAVGGWKPSLRFSLAATKELFSFGTGVFVKRLVDYGSNNLDNLVVARMLGMSALGFYDKAFSLMKRALARVNTGGPTVSFRIFAIISEDPERFRAAYRRVVMTSTLVSYPVFACISMAASDLVIVMFGVRWKPTVLPFQILCLAADLRVSTEYAGSAAQAHGRIWAQVWRQTVSVILLVLFVFLFCRWGIAGAAAGVLVSNAILALLMDGLLLKTTVLRLRDLIEPQIPSAALAGVAGASTLAGVYLAGLVTSVPIVALGIELLCGVAAVAVCLRTPAFRFVRALIHDVASDLPPIVKRTVARIA